MITHGQLPKALDGAVAEFYTLYDSDERGTLLSDVRAFSRPLSVIPPREEAKKFRLSLPTQVMLTAWSQRHDLTLDFGTAAAMHKSMVIRGVRFLVHNQKIEPGKFSAQCLIAFGGGVPNDWKAGNIEQIFTLSDETFLLLRVFQDLDAEESVHDHYRRFPIGGGRIYSKRQPHELVLIHWREVICHIAYVPSVSGSLAIPHFLALPLDRVSLLRA